MSYDIWLEVDTGGDEPARIEHDHLNMTSNVAKMWRHAGADLAEFDGKRAGDCTEDLATAINAMMRDPAPYKAMNPSNGWGSYEDCVAFLMKLLGVLHDHPNAMVRVWR